MIYLALFITLVKLSDRLTDGNDDWTLGGFKSIFFESFDDVFESDGSCESVSVIDRRFAVTSVPTVQFNTFATGNEDT